MYDVYGSRAQDIDEKSNFFIFLFFLKKILKYRKIQNH